MIVGLWWVVWKRMVEQGGDGWGKGRRLKNARRGSGKIKCQGASQTREQKGRRGPKKRVRPMGKNVTRGRVVGGRVSRERYSKPELG